MYLPSLPTRAPLNMKKSFGVRKSHRTSLMEALAGRSSIIPNRKTFFGQTILTDPTPTTVETVAKSVETKQIPIEVDVESAVTPVQEIPNPVTKDPAEDVPKDVPRGKKDKDDTITIIDTELHLGDQRLKSKFTTDSLRIHDALNNLRTKSTPGQPLRDGQEKFEAETPAPSRMAERHVIEVDDDDWIPSKDYSSLSERLANGQVTSAQTVKTVEDVEEHPMESETPQVFVQREASPAPTKSPAPISVGPPPQSPATATFKNAAAEALDVIRNAMAVITNPEPQEPPQDNSTNLYPSLDFDNDPMTEVHNVANENFTVHYDDRLSLDSRRDSTYFTQSEGPSQPSQAEPEIATQPTHEHRQSHTAMPPPRKEQFPTKPKPVPVSIRVPTASQRQKEQQKKAITQGGGMYPALSQSRSVPDLATPGKMAREEARMSSVSVQSTGGFVRGAGQIKALNAAKMAKQKVLRLQSC
jgi:hypothetical protein